MVFEPVEDEASFPLAEMAAQGGAFDFLADEPDLYSEADLKQRNV